MYPTEASSYDSERPDFTSGLGLVGKPSELGQQLLRLHQNAERLIKAVSDLESRLSPVLRATEEGKSPSSLEETINTAHAQSAYEAACKVERTIQVLASVMQRLEV